MEPGISVAHLSWPCALCGAVCESNWPKYQIRTTMLGSHDDHEICTGNFQRHLCLECSKRLDDVLMAAISNWHKNI